MNPPTSRWFTSNVILYFLWKMKNIFQNVGSCSYDWHFKGLNIYIYGFQIALIFVTTTRKGFLEHMPTNKALISLRICVASKKKIRCTFTKSDKYKKAYTDELFSFNKDPDQTAKMRIWAFVFRICPEDAWRGNIGRPICENLSRVSVWQQINILNWCFVAILIFDILFCYNQS